MMIQLFSGNDNASLSVEIRYTEHPTVVINK